MNAVAAIPACSGSKGSPREDMRRLAGMPLIVHPIEQGQLADSVERIVVSIDDWEIATFVDRAARGREENNAS